MKKKYHYSGDVNLECGGYFYTLKDWDNYGYSEVVRIIPCSDAGLQDNAWWVETITVNQPSDEQKLNDILSCYGYKIGVSGDIVDENGSSIIAELGSETYNHVLIDACIGYGRYDQEWEESIQIGKKDKFHGGEFIKCDVELGANWTLKGYVKKHYLN